MKPCARNRKPIAALSLDLLEPQEAQNLRHHLEACSGCRQYLAELSDVVHTLETTEVKAELRPSENFHRRFTRALQAEESRPPWNTLLALIRAQALNWRVALPALGATVVMVWVISGGHHPGPAAPAGGSTSAQIAIQRGYDLSPTLAHYQHVASRSLDELDDLLTQQGNHRVAPVRDYTASGQMFAKLSD